MSAVKKKRMNLPNQEMIDPYRSENEGYKVYWEDNGRIELESALPKNWGLSRTLKWWKDDDLCDWHKKMVSL